MMSSNNTTESIVTLSRRAFILLLIAFLWLGATCLTIAFLPENFLARWPMHAPWIFPAALIMAWVGLLLSTLRGPRWDPHGAEARVVMNDEFRQSNLLRAHRAALIAVLVLQVPLALATMHLPVTRALVAMAGSTITLAMIVLISTFLYLDRE
jgi:hypothetical protein